MKFLLPEVNWLAVHWAYFIFTCLFSAILLWATATPFRSLEFTDALFLATSAMTEAGLNTVNLSTLDTFQQIVLLVLIVMGSVIFVSASIIFARVRAFEKEFAVIIKRQREQKQKRTMTSLGRHELRFSSPPLTYGLRFDDRNQVGRQQNVSEDGSEVSTFQVDRAYRAWHQTPPLCHSQTDAPAGIGSAMKQGPAIQRLSNYNGEFHNLASKSIISYLMSRREIIEEYQRSLTSPVLEGRSSQFFSLSFSERQRLGGYEYRAVLFLSFLVPIYFVLWQLLGCLSCGAWIAYHRARLRSRMV